MKLATFTQADRTRIGAVVGDEIVDFEAAAPDRAGRDREPRDRRTRGYTADLKRGESRDHAASTRVLASCGATRDVVLVFDLAHDLLENIFQRHHA